MCYILDRRLSPSSWVTVTCLLLNVYISLARPIVCVECSLDIHMKLFQPFEDRNTGVEAFRIIGDAVVATMCSQIGGDKSRNTELHILSQMQEDLATH